MIRFACRHCGHNLLARPEAVGKAAVCGGCGQQVYVPEPGAGVRWAGEDPPEDAGRDLELEAILRRRRKKAGRATAGAYFAIASVLAAAAVMAIVLVARKASRAEDAAKSIPARPAVAARPDPQPRWAPEPEYDRRPGYRGEAAGDARDLVWFGIRVAAATAWVLFWSLLTVWVIRDARNRAVDSSFFWGIMIFGLGTTTLIGGLVCLGLYLGSRPLGGLTVCEHCRGRRLPYVAVCPHCHRPVQPLGQAGRTAVEG